MSVFFFSAEVRGNIAGNGSLDVVFPFYSIFYFLFSLNRGGG